VRLSGGTAKPEMPHAFLVVASGVLPVIGAVRRSPRIPSACPAAATTSAAPPPPEVIPKAPPEVIPGAPPEAERQARPAPSAARLRLPPPHAAETHPRRVSSDRLLSALSFRGPTSPPRVGDFCADSGTCTVCPRPSFIEQPMARTTYASTLLRVIDSRRAEPGSARVPASSRSTRPLPAWAPGIAVAAGRTSVGVDAPDIRGVTGRLTIDAEHLRILQTALSEGKIQSLRRLLTLYHSDSEPESTRESPDTKKAKQPQAPRRPRKRRT
jgi:hypothetical protein